MRRHKRGISIKWLSDNNVTRLFQHYLEFPHICSKRIVLLLSDMSICVVLNLKIE